MGASLPYMFDANQVKPNEGKPPALPTGWYPMVITESENKMTRDQSGWFAELTLKVVSGEYAGRLVWDRLNLSNPNPVAVEIAQGTLSAICHSTGVYQLQDIGAVHNIPMDVKVVYVPAKDGYDEKNDVKGYVRLGTHTGAQAPGAGAPAAPAWGSPAAPAAPTAPAPAAPNGPPAGAPPWGAPAPTAAPPAAAPWGGQPAAPQFTPPAPAPTGPPKLPWEK